MMMDGRFREWKFILTPPLQDIFFSSWRRDSAIPIRF